MTLVTSTGEGCQCFTQVFQYPAVIHDQTVILAFRYSVSPGDSLHQGMRLQRLVQIEGRKCGHIKSGQPHGTDNGDSKRVFAGSKGFFHVQSRAISQFKSCFKQLAVRLDIQPPFFKLGDFTLLFTDHNRHQRFFHPRQLPLSPS